MLPAKGKKRQRSIEVEQRQVFFFVLTWNAINQEKVIKRDKVWILNDVKLRIRKNSLFATLKKKKISCNDQKYRLTPALWVTLTPSRTLFKPEPISRSYLRRFLTVECAGVCVRSHTFKWWRRRRNQSTGEDLLKQSSVFSCKMDQPLEMQFRFWHIEQQMCPEWGAEEVRSISFEASFRNRCLNLNSDGILKR